MAYAASDLILHDHYNVFATGGADGTATHAVANINTLWGVGSGDKGYGQSTTLTSVAAGATVTATQWSTLVGRLNSLLIHQSGGAGSGITLPTAGATIAYISSLSGSITTATTNRLLFNSTRGSASTTAYTAGWSSATPTSFQQVRTVTFADSDSARYFFNAGGRISLGFSVINGADNSKEAAWTALIATALETLNFDQTTNTRTGTGGTLTTDGSALGFWDMLTTDQKLIRLTDTTAAYTANYVDVWCRVTGPAGVNGGKGNVVTFTIDYYDGAADTTQDLGVPPVGQAFDAISMTVGASVTITPPETTNLSASWGTVTPATALN